MEEKTNKKKSNDLTELVFILDKSGSMQGLEKDTIGGFNSLIERQKAEDGECFVTTVLFNHKSEKIHDRMKLSYVRPLNTNDYVTCGSTALIDTLGDTINHIANIHKYARPEDIPTRTLFVITTDGLENSSHKYSSDEVKDMVEHYKREKDWEFIFIGANIDAVETAKEYGIEEDFAVDYLADEEGTKKVYDSVCESITMLKEDSLDRSWKKNIESDYKRRKNSSK